MKLRYFLALGLLCAALLLSSCIEETPTPTGLPTQPPPAATATLPDTPLPTPLPLQTIMQVQGAAFRSPMEGASVRIEGVVTAYWSEGFWLQDPAGDGDPATSDGIYIYTRTTPKVRPGDRVSVSGVVTEYYPGGFATNNLSTTELTSPVVEVLQKGGEPLAPTRVGVQGRRPANRIFTNDAQGDVEQSGVFDPEEDGLDFWESLEGMLIQIDDAATVGPTSQYNEIPLISQPLGELRTPRGGLVIQAGDFNPERILIDDLLRPVRQVRTGTTFNKPVVGVLDYSFGTYKLLITQELDPKPADPPKEKAQPAQDGELSVATFNVENLSAGSDPARLRAIARQIVENLGAPDILGLQEVQDNNGVVNDRTVDASASYEALIQAILDLEGPAYSFRDLPPVDDLDGGVPGGNIRVGFLFRPDRVSFVDRPGGDSTTPVQVEVQDKQAVLSFSPGRIDPTNPAFLDSRKPLVGEFEFNGQRLFVIVNHLNSKGGDAPLSGRLQPPLLPSETQRTQQAMVINTFVRELLRLDGQARVIVLGDLNDFYFSAPVFALKKGALFNLYDQIPANERYSYIYEGNSQTLDHILVSKTLLDSLAQFDVLHLNSDYPPSERTSDHDPLLARFCLGEGCR